MRIKCIWHFNLNTKVSILNRIDNSVKNFIILLDIYVGFLCLSIEVIFVALVLIYHR